MGLKDRFTKGAAPTTKAGDPASDDQQIAPADVPEPDVVPVPDEDDSAVSLDGVPGEIRALADKKLAYKMGVRRELKALHEILGEGEAVLNMAAGEYDGRQGLLVVTERRLIFFEKGLARSRQEDFPYSKVSSIQTETKMMSGRLIIFVSGNKALIKSVLPKERVVEIGEYVRQRISDALPNPPVPAPGSIPTGPAERMRHLQAMRDQGLVTDEEFQAKRSEILDAL